ncbi:unnamed protein product [Allacma fusca]|uniref:Uncharacterized protein n=1 Tax=Allacma fusca TaxID=39272 RepID=A0A8J2NPB4_9HEXA|nr:unnamed protein product [Allacma fusca]
MKVQKRKKRRTLQTRDNANKIGRGGGRDTHNVVGLNLPQTVDPSPATPAGGDLPQAINFLGYGEASKGSAELPVKRPPNVIPPPHPQ